MQTSKLIFLAIAFLVSSIQSFRVHRGNFKPHRHHHHSASYHSKTVEDPHYYEEQLRTRLLESPRSDQDLLSSLAQLPNSNDSVVFSTMNPADKEFFGAIKAYMGISLEFNE